MDRFALNFLYMKNFFLYSFYFLLILGLKPVRDDNQTLSSICGGICDADFQLSSHLSKECPGGFFPLVLNPWLFQQNFEYLFCSKSGSTLLFFVFAQYRYRSIIIQNIFWHSLRLAQLSPISIMRKNSVS